jgi:ParB-like chromosome segregation protein Spo0J
MLEITLVGIEKLKPNDRNPRTHPRKQVQQIADSITAFGYVNPILVDEEGGIIAGHGRYAALLLLGRKEVPVIELRGLSKPSGVPGDRRQQNRPERGLGP